jgi:catechol 2,3-dioxygenase-like lactoylglutathione lyase family enzyme
VDRAQADLDFCLEALGLRLVKKTVNFDNHHVYHFYYGDERARRARSGRRFRITIAACASASRAPARSRRRRSRAGGFADVLALAAHARTACLPSG